MVIAHAEGRLVVLWSDPPKEPDFSNFVLPIVRNVNYSAIARQLITVQPMSLPTGNIFYMDYAYGEDKTKTGPLWSRLYWRARRWMTKAWSAVTFRVRLLRVKLGRRTPRLFNQDEYLQKVIEEFSKRLK